MSVFLKLFGAYEHTPIMDAVIITLDKNTPQGVTIITMKSISSNLSNSIRDIVALEQSKMSGMAPKTRKQNSKKTNQRIARTRRQRGYNWEDTLVKRFNALDGWKAFRLGSPSVALPDILAVSTKENTLYTMEAKSGTNTTLRVPFDQIQRCLKWTHTFELYQKRKMIIAFKFSSKKRIGTGKYEHRELREFFKIWDEKYPVTDFICTYEGDTYSMSEGKRGPLKLEDAMMPFIKKQVLTPPNTSLI